MTPEELARATGARIGRTQLFLPFLTEAMNAYYISLTSDRMAYFLANVGHESGGLRYTTEIWGPTPTQLRYEGRQDLGNTQPGDGSLFRGHGLFQTTGRANHAAARDRLRSKFPELDVPDFEAEPHRLAEPFWAAYSAADFADMENLNAVADSGDFDGYCDRINRGHKTRAEGDSNGYAERFALLGRAREEFA